MASPSRIRGPGVLATLLGLFFLGVGIAHVFGLPFLVQRFEAWGYSAGFRLFVGLLEMIGGVLMLFRRGASLAAIGLSLVMLGATYTELFLGTAVFALVPIAFLVLLSVVAVRRWNDLVEGMGSLSERHVDR